MEANELSLGLVVPCTLPVLTGSAVEQEEVKRLNRIYIKTVL